MDNSNEDEIVTDLRQRLSDAQATLDQLIEEIGTLTQIVADNDGQIVADNDGQIVELRQQADQEAERFDIAELRVRDLEIERELLSK